MTPTPDTPALDTKRLLLRYLTLDDAPFMLQLVNSPGWLQYIGDRNVKNLDAARTYIENGAIKSYQDNGYGPFLICRKADSLPIGMCGLFKRPSLNHADIGFALLPEFGGQGYAFEAASAVMQFAIDVLRMPQIWAITLPGNDRSAKLLEKLGLQFQKMVRLDNDKEDLMLFATPMENDSYG